MALTGKQIRASLTKRGIAVPPPTSLGEIKQSYGRLKRSYKRAKIVDGVLQVGKFVGVAALGLVAGYKLGKRKKT